MDFLKEWVRGLVLLMILATCLELLVPMNGLKKYVRMTMGLLVVLAVIQPILSVMGQTVTVTNLFPEEQSTNLPTINQIMAKAGEFREKNRALALTEAQIKLSAEAVQAARSVKGVAEAHAAVVLDQVQGDYRIRSVAITVTPGPAPGAARPVRPVEPVRVGGDTARPAGENQAAREPVAAENALVESVRREAASRLGLSDPQSIKVFIDRQGGKGP